MDLNDRHARQLDLEERSRALEERLAPKRANPEQQSPTRRVVRRKPRLAKVIDMAEWKAKRGRA